MPDLNVAKKKIGTSLSAHVGVDPEIDYELGVFFGSKLDSLTDAGRNRIMSLSLKNPTFAWSLGHGAGWKFKKFSWKLRDWVIVSAHKNPYFAGGFGHSISRHVRKLAVSDSLEPIMEFAIKHPEFAFELAYDLGYHFGVLPERIKEMVYNLATKNDQFAFRVGEGIGGVYEKLGNKDKEFVFDFTDKSEYFSKGFFKSSPKKNLKT